MSVGRNRKLLPNLDFDNQEQDQKVLPVKTETLRFFTNLKKPKQRSRVRVGYLILPELNSQHVSLIAGQRN